MTDPKTVQFLWQYMIYADRHVLAASLTLDDEGYFRKQRISAGSVHNLLVHSMSAQTTWLQRLKRLGTPPMHDPAMIGRRELPQLWKPLQQELIAFAMEQTPESMAVEIQSTTRKGVAFRLPVGLCMLHVSDHATYHRGQINSMIKLAGGTPSPVMLYSFGVREGFGREE